MTITADTDSLVKRIATRLNRVGPNDPNMKAALTRIGLIVSSETILNIRRADLIDTGRLINSIRYELFQDGSRVGINVGSFGVPYAVVHEFGYNGVVQVPTHTRTISKAFGRNIAPVSFQVSPHSRSVNIKAKWFLRNAVRRHKEYVIDTIRAALRG